MVRSVPMWQEYTPPVTRRIPLRTLAQSLSLLSNPHTEQPLRATQQVCFQQLALRGAIVGCVSLRTTKYSQPCPLRPRGFTRALGGRRGLSFD